MKHLFLILLLLAAPVHGQPAEPEQPAEPDSGLSLMERGAQMFFEGLMREVEPTLRDLEGVMREMEPALKDFVDKMGPALTTLLGKVDDLANYDPPEMLPNGDIILRRKPAVPPAPDQRPDQFSDPVPDPDTGAVDL
jgi:hypothetical protein